MAPPRGLSPSDFRPNAFRTESGLVSAWMERAGLWPSVYADPLHEGVSVDGIAKSLLA